MMLSWSMVPGWVLEACLCSKVKSGETKGVWRKAGGGKVWQGLGNGVMCVENYGLTLLLV